MKTAPRSHAFTLLELLVAVSVLSILIVVLMNVVGSATSLWRGSENRAESYREARAALQVMASDFECNMASTNTNYFVTLLSGADSTTLANGQAGFLASLPVTAQATNSKSEVCTVAFFAAYGPKSPIAGTNGLQGWNLYRYFLESNETFSRLTNSGALFTSVNPANTNCEILARNILYLKITPLVALTNSAGIITNFSTNWDRSINPIPHLVEIQTISVNNERARRLLTQADWIALRANSNSIDYLKNTKTFTTRVKLNTP
jgi:prepilin-type N-terminal cleavage/methylation domain-containing protein